MLSDSVTCCNHISTHIHKRPSAQQLVYYLLVALPLVTRSKADRMEELQDSEGHEAEMDVEAFRELGVQVGKLCCWWWKC